MEFPCVPPYLSKISIFYPNPWEGLIEIMVWRELQQIKLFLELIVVRGRYDIDYESKKLFCHHEVKIQELNQHI